MWRNGRYVQAYDYGTVESVVSGHRYGGESCRITLRVLPLLQALAFLVLMCGGE